MVACDPRVPAAVFAVFAAFVVLGTLELALPVGSERVLTQGSAGGTPWHPRHVAERYGLLTIIVLGEGVVGTVASSGEFFGGADGTHRSGNAIAVVIAGVGLTYGMWWVYFATPFGDVLVLRRNREYLFGRRWADSTGPGLSQVSDARQAPKPGTGPAGTATRSRQPAPRAPRRQRRRRTFRPASPKRW